MDSFLPKWILANGLAAAAGWALGEFIAAWLGPSNMLIGFTVGILVFRAIVYFAQKRALGIYNAIPEIARFWRIMRAVLELGTLILVEGLVANSPTPNWGMVGAVYFFVSDTLIWLLLALIMVAFRRGGGLPRFLLAVVVGVLGSFVFSGLLSLILVAALELQKYLGGSIGWATAGLITGSLTGLLSGIAILLILRGLSRDYAFSDARIETAKR